jgi:hypothetical protein
MTPGAQQVEGGKTALVDHDGVAVDKAGRRGGRECETIVLDLVDPAVVGRRLFRRFQAAAVRYR